MKVIVFEETAYYKMLDELTQRIKEAVKEVNKESIAPKVWVSTEEAKKLLSIKSKSKLQQLRDNKDIIYSQHGRNISYNYESIMNFLERNSNT